MSAVDPADRPDLNSLGVLTQDGRSLPDRVAEAVTEAIRSGRYRQGQRLPDTYAIARHFGCSHMSVLRAMRLLNDNGVVRSVQGRGVFVRGVA